jgi:sialic acid synthase SpsE
MADFAALHDWSARVLLIAEAGVNHEGDRAAAIRMVEEAARAGADVVKFQTYTAERLATRTSGAYWDTDEEPTGTQFELFKKYDSLGPDDYTAIAAACRENGIEFLTTPFDVDVVEWLDPLLSFWKIASGDITNVPLLERVAATEKPVALSTGASTLDEVAAAVATLRGGGAPDVALLHCTLSYPTAPEDAALGALVALRSSFPDAVLGYSDHTVPPVSFAAIETAVGLGARVVEKHYSLDTSKAGNDHYHAFDPVGFAELRVRLDLVQELLGRPEKLVLPAEEAARVGARRSVVARGDIACGTVLTREMLDVKRPGGGIEPAELETLVGRRSARDIEDDTPLAWDMVEAS